MQRWILALAALTTSACTHSIHQVHVSDFTPYESSDKRVMVRAYGEQFVVMYFKFDSDYVERAYVDLQTACRTGDIIGITTQHSTSHGFFSWTNKVLIKGQCLQ